MGALCWESVKQDGNSGGRLRRAKVPGGWLLLLTTGEDPAILQFFPDPQHSWDVELEEDRSMPEGRGWDRR